MRVAALLLMTVLFLGSPVASLQAAIPRSNLAQLQEKHRQHHAQFMANLEKLATDCEQKGLTEAAVTVRESIRPIDDVDHHRKTLPKDVQPEIPVSLPEQERFWRMQLRHLRNNYAQELYLLSRRVLYLGLPSYAYQLVRETAVHDPDHTQARKILGFVRYGTEWVTPFAAKMLREHNVWSDQYGWLPKSSLDRYLAGERMCNGRWMSATQEGEIRRDFRQAWEIRTDHYLVKTNYDLERGVELASSLEQFYTTFHEIFAGFFNTPEQMQRLFESSAGAPGKLQRPYIVHFYRTKDEYVSRLQRQFPQIGSTNGFYQTDERIVHFFYDPAINNEATLFHEATHQLFFESHLGRRQIAENAYFWIVEGIACYMESFQHDGQGVSLGDSTYIRFVGAHHNAINEKYYVPLREFSSMGSREFQTVPLPALAKNYTQAAGLAWFLMDADKGRYRQSLIEQLMDLYSANAHTRANARGLDELTGEDYEELDRQYLEFLATQKLQR